MSRLQPAKAVAWWRALQPDPDHSRKGDRAALARLRRCATIAEAMQDPATIALFRCCGGADPDDLPTVGLAAALLAHVRRDDPGATLIARRIGPDNTDDPATALLKPLRFRHLMAADTPDERLTAFRRLIALADGTLNLFDLATALLCWDEERQRRWVYDYWNAGQPTRTADTEETAA
ncbi:MAG: type I-E CRISPR-associated protein Cse2/CasB [Azospirillaceae bacterium]|nr:type I-E CRISPR-associated protein Cse2/CasB [Azospirillaceae bacterium]